MNWVKHKLHLLDADTPEIYNDAHIPGAVNVSMDKVEELSKGWNKKTPVVVYCSCYDCGASHGVAAELKNMALKM